MARVFIETTIPSFYYDTRPDRRSRDWHAQTRLWWDRYRSSFELVTSEFVVAEFKNSPIGKPSHAEAFFEGIVRLPIDDRVPGLVRHCIRHFAMPNNATGDAAHLAMSSIHGVDFLLTWNGEHLANASKARNIRVLNDRLGLKTPTITTPFVLLPEWQTMPARRKKTRRSAPAAFPPAVAEVRAIRAAMWRRAGRTIEGLIDLARKEAARVSETKPAVRKRRPRKAA